MKSIKSMAVVVFLQNRSVLNLERNVSVKIENDENPPTMPPSKSTAANETHIHEGQNKLHAAKRTILPVQNLSI